MSNEPIRILNVVGLMSPGGIETLIMNVYRNIDRTKVQFDFLVHKGQKGLFDDEIIKMGGRIFWMPKLRDGNKTNYFNYFKYKKALKTFFKNHPEYHVLHGHMTNTASIYMPIAKKYGKVTCCIAHSHLTQARPGLSGFITNLLHKRVPKVATDYFACSEMAARWIFKQKDIDNGKVKIIKNGVDPNIFFYDKDEAISIKKELCLEGKIVIGNVARFKKEKNHSFQIEIIKNLVKINKNYVLLLVGDGELKEEIETKVRDANLTDNVRFLGVRSDVNKLMLAMDLFLLPSLYEGLPVVGIEAQAAGLLVYTSTGVTRETDITGNVRFLDLNLGASAWANEIDTGLKSFKRVDVRDYINQNGYNIVRTATWLQDFYLQKYNDGNKNH